MECLFVPRFNKLHDHYEFQNGRHSVDHLPSHHEEKYQPAGVFKLDSSFR
ncbi:hypothetical protein ACE6H2_005123 [Prunus campanulata]